jgi:PAS domain S-box-containing protein
VHLQESNNVFLGRPELAQNSPELAACIATTDWASTPLGPTALWSPALKVMTEHVLGSGYGSLLWWGPEHVQIYNDAYRPILGTKHPRSLGQPAAECWPEIWNIIGPMVEQPFRGGLPSVTDDLRLVVNRHGFPEETHFTVAYSPVFDDLAPNGIGGVLATVHETTERVISARRLQLLRNLSAGIAGSQTIAETAVRAVDAIAGNIDDVAFVSILTIDKARNRTSVLAHAGERIPFPTTIFAVEKFLGTGLSGLRSARSIHDFIAVPLALGADGVPAALLVAGAGSGHVLDAEYLDFFDLVAAPISSAMLNAVAYEAERARARALEELDRAKSEFFSNVSHEFRTPLTLMLGPLSQLSGSDDFTTRDLAEKARRNSLRLLKLVNTLLEYTQLQAGRAEATFAKTDLATLTRHLIGLFGSAFEGAGLDIRTDIAFDATAFVDRAMWERIVLNLISNAIKFTVHGGVSVSLHGSGESVELVVADTGVGIPETELPHIFERFHRVRSSISRSHEGSGIGLALVKDLVELHGGSISAQSREGHGTSFTVRIPTGAEHLNPDRVVALDDDDEYASSVEQYMAEVSSTMRLQPNLPLLDDAAQANRKSVLLVDDNADLLEYLNGILSKRYRVTCARNGLEALANLHKDPFDVVVSDVMMPLMDGFELLHAIRNDEELRATPFIMLSARAGDQSAVEGLTAGADDYLTKPFNADDLTARIYAQIHGSALRQEAMQRLKASEDRFRTLASSLPNIVIETDARGRITFLSEAFARLTGIPVERIYGEQWTIALHGDDASDALESWSRHVQTGDPFEGEVRLIRNDGGFRWHHVSALPQRDAAGTIVRWAGTITDIHDRRLALEERGLLAEASQIFLQSLDVTTTLQAITRFAVARLADWSQIDLRRPDGKIVTAAIAHRDPVKNQLAQELVGRIHLDPQSERGAAFTIRTGQCELIPDVSADIIEAAVSDDIGATIYGELGTLSAMCAPLTADGETVGSLTCASAVRGKYSEDDITVMQELGRRAAVALQKAEAFEREHKVAESFQEASLPPSLPRVPGVHFDAVYVAGRSEAQVGGDWYDAVRLLDGRLVLSIGDVAGSGLAAAVRMGNMRQIIRGIAQVHADPTLMLDAADRALRLEHPEQFVTAFVGVLDPIGKTLTYASAGHPPALLRTPDERIVQLCDGGLPLGLRLYQTTKQSTTIKIEDGSLLLLYTDGLTEMRHDPLADEARLIEILRDKTALESNHPAAYVKGALLGDADPHDDVAILAMRFDHFVSPSTNHQVRYRWSFDAADFQAGSAARREFSAVLGEEGVLGEDLYAAELVFGELIGNVVRYTAGKVEITLDCSASPPVLHVLDSGLGFRHIAILPDLFSERGRGLFIVSALTQDFHVTQRPEGGSHARAVLSLKSPGPAGSELQGSLLKSLVG